MADDLNDMPARLTDEVDMENAGDWLSRRWGATARAALATGLASAVVDEGV
jgi:hypothetical protein